MADAAFAAPSLVVMPSESKFDHVPELQALFREDSRFTWTALSTPADARPLQLLTRARGAAAPDHAGHHAQLAAFLEADSIPQYVWPAADPMREWLFAHSALFAGKTVLELGCGTGIIGLTVAQFAKHVILTDCSPVALAMVQESVAHNRLRNCTAAALSWGREDQLAYLKATCGVAAFDVVIGSDVFYFNNTLRSGLATARSALTPPTSAEAAFVCGSVARSERMEFDLEEMPGQSGFVLADLVKEEPFHLYYWKLSTAPVPASQ